MRGRSGLVGLAAAVLIAFAILGNILLRDDTTYDLRWKLSPGKVLRYRVATDTLYPNSRNELRHITRFRVAEGSPVLVEGVNERAAVYNFDSAGEVRWDSAKNSNPPDHWLARMMVTGVGKPFTFRMDERGRATERHQERELAEAAWRESFLARLMPAPQGETYGNPMTTLEFPSKPVPIGYSWTAWTGNGKRLERFALREVAAGVAVIEGELVKMASSGTWNGKAGDLPEPKVVERTTFRFSLQDGHLLLVMRNLKVDGSLSDGKPFGYTMTEETALVGGE